MIDDGDEGNAIAINFLFGREVDGPDLVDGNGVGDSMFESFEVGEFSRVLFECVSDERFGDGLIFRRKELIKGVSNEAVRMRLEFSRDV